MAFPPSLEPFMTVLHFPRVLAAALAVVVLLAGLPALAGEGKWSQGKGMHCRIVPTQKPNGVLVNVVTCGKFGV